MYCLCNESKKFGYGNISYYYSKQSLLCPTGSSVEFDHCSTGYCLYNCVKPCTYSGGTITFSSNPASVNVNVTAVASGFVSGFETGCIGKTLVLMQGYTYSLTNIIEYCTIDDFGICRVTFKPNSQGSYMFHLYEALGSNMWKDPGYSGILNVGP